VKIILSPEVGINLEAIRGQVGEQEFSGIGFCKIIDGDIYCYEILLLDVGTKGYTEISSELLMEALENRHDKNNARLWFHRHPIEGWSTTDLNTIMTAPMGGIPEIVKWSTSIVRTPSKWIGRVDNHLAKSHVVVVVEPNINPILIAHTDELLTEYKHFTEKALQADEMAYMVDIPSPSYYQSSLLRMVDGEELDDWLDVAYTDDEKDGWEIGEDVILIANYPQRNVVL
jgi:hypothetical protein